jgi:hypothetical protein
MPMSHANSFSAVQIGFAQDRDCVALRPVSIEGRELRRVSCVHGSRGNDAGTITIGVDPNPTSNAEPVPFGYLVVIWNDSDDSLDVDWIDWVLSWTDHNGEHVSSTALDPDRIHAELVDSSLHKTTLFGRRNVVGWVYFDKPTGSTADLTASLSGVARFRFSVSTEPKP